MRNAVAKQNASKSLDFYWQPADPTAEYFIYMHFADFQNSQIRKFDITLNGESFSEAFIPNYLSVFTIYTETPWSGPWFNFSFTKTSDSELPPMINAIEVYIKQDFLSPLTDQQDVDAIKIIKSAYGVEKNWQGDPCMPESFSWPGLSCFNDSFEIPRISSLNLSFSGLSGTISPSILNLGMLQSLDLSNNNLTGEVPAFLSRLQNLSVLNLSGNNFTGTVPSELIKKSKSGFLKLSVEGNPNLCSTNSSCKTTSTTNLLRKNKKSSLIFPIIAALAGIVVLLFAVAVAVVWVCIIRKQKSQAREEREVARAGDVTREEPILKQQQQYSYREVIKMTKNFERVLGKGGFGSVFYGSISNTQVAVKMISPSSTQGYKQFKAEAELLTRVHHKNLTTLIGYCNEGDKLGLIYEFMVNGDLQSHLSDKNLKCFSWDLRLEIALDAAQGLEYMHTGCAPPIIHRDIKTTNILLNEEMHAKLADFGLSKAFPTDDTPLSTRFAGTPGYFDPEYNLNQKGDIFSFGIVLLEILTGKPPIAKDGERTHISRWVPQTLETKGDIRDVIDPRLGNDFDVSSAWKFLDVAMECASPASIQRPIVNQVVIDLKYCLGMEKARMKNQTENETTEYSNLNIGVAAMYPLPR